MLWSWFAAPESHNRLSQNQAGIVETPGLSYGLFHAVAQPVYSWGVVRRVEFPGVNMDIDHIRNLTWAKDNDREKWIAYNRLRGQYMSALDLQATVAVLDMVPAPDIQSVKNAFRRSEISVRGLGFCHRLAARFE